LIPIDDLAAIKPAHVLFQRFFEQIVDLCQEAGLVWGRELYFDGTKVEANADLDSLVPRFSYEAKRHLGDLFADEQAPHDGGSSTLPDLPAGVVPTRSVGFPPWRAARRKSAHLCWGPLKPGSRLSATRLRVNSRPCQHYAKK